MRPGVLTLFAGMGLADDGANTLRVGARWALGLAMSLDLEGAQREDAGGGRAEQRVGLSYSANW